MKRANFKVETESGQHWFVPEFYKGKDRQGAYLDVMNVQFALRHSAIQLIADQLLRKENEDE